MRDEGKDSVMAPLVTLRRRMNHIGIRDIRQRSPVRNRRSQQRVNISHFGTAIQNVLQPPQTAALDAHFLRVRHCRIAARASQCKRKSAAQLCVQFVAALLTAGTQTPRNFTLGNLYARHTSA